MKYLRKGSEKLDRQSAEGNCNCNLLSKTHKEVWQAATTSCPSGGKWVGKTMAMGWNGQWTVSDGQTLPMGWTTNNGMDTVQCPMDRLWQVATTNIGLDRLWQAVTDHQHRRHNATRAIFQPDQKFEQKAGHASPGDHIH